MLESDNQQLLVRDAHARSARENKLLLACVVVLTALRGLLAAHLPLSFDEAYFWTWSKHLAIAYYDHPPMIALAIKLGTLLFGDTEFGVRFVSLATSIAASWAVWKSAAIVLKHEAAGPLACVLFNATLMVAAETMAAIPDALVLVASAFLVFSIAKLEEEKDGRWWMAAGVAIALSLESKYTGFFLAMSATLWALGTPQGRNWLGTPWPYAAAVIGLCAFAPTVWWNAVHAWISFRFQFGRVVKGTFDPEYLLEFFGSQIALASPLTLLLGGVGLARVSTRAGITKPLFFAAALVWPALIYFTIHALHDRMQGNWPSFAYPAVANLAASVLLRGAREEVVWLRRSRALTLPIALLILAFAYAQAFFGLVALGKSDPIARMTAVGIAPVAQEVSLLATREHAVGIVTTRYVVTGWLKFYLEPKIPIAQIDREYRFLAAPRASAWFLKQRLIYVTQHPKKESTVVSKHFSIVRPLAALMRTDNGKEVDRFYVYLLSGFHGKPVGRMP